MHLVASRGGRVHDLAQVDVDARPSDPRSKRSLLCVVPRLAPDTSACARVGQQPWQSHCGGFQSVPPKHACGRRPMECPRHAVHCSPHSAAQHHDVTRAKEQRHRVRVTPRCAATEQENGRAAE